MLDHRLVWLYRRVRQQYQLDGEPLLLSFISPAYVLTPDDLTALLAYKKHHFSYYAFAWD